MYYEDVRMTDFTAVVTECVQEKGQWKLVLDQTAFYPEGGGQPADQGTLETGPKAEMPGGIPAGEGETGLPGRVPESGQVRRVTDVHEKNGKIFHYVDGPLPEGTAVRGRIDWDRRFDLMQQHSGEHIVSGLIHAKYGYDNVGFHMGSDVVTIDFNGLLNEEQLSGIEEEANRILWRNEAVEILYPSGEELEMLAYRSKKELTGQVRIVRFPGADTCACCGTHVVRTGEIGIVRILSVVKFREGVRVEMMAGGRVRTRMRVLEEENHRISVRLSAKPEETSTAVERLWQENFALKGRLMRLEEEKCLQAAKEYAGKGDVLLFEEGLSPDAVRKLVDAVMEVCGGRCALFSESGDGTYKYAIGQKGADLRSFTKELNQALQGRGGGKPFFVQGSVKASEEEILAFFER